MIQVVEIFPKCVGRRLEDEIAAPETSNGFNPSAPNRLGSMFCEMQFTHASSSYIDTSMIPFGYTNSYKYLYILYIYTNIYRVTSSGSNNQSNGSFLILSKVNSCPQDV